MTDLMQKFSTLKGAKFVGINGYKSVKSGEVSNFTINCNISVENAKKADLETLKNFPASQLNEIAKEIGATKEEALKAIEELIASAERNLTSDNRTTSSVSQTDTYTQLGKGIKFHNETGDLYITGFANTKTVLVEGEYKKVNSAPKTKVKKAINKTLKMSKFRSFKLSNIGRDLNVTGSTVQLG